MDSLGHVYGDHLAYFHNEGGANDLLCNFNTYLLLYCSSFNDSLPLTVSPEAREETMMQRNLFNSNGSRRALCTVLMVATLVILLVACGSNTSSSGSGGTTPTSSSVYGGGRSGGGWGGTPTASPTRTFIQTTDCTASCGTGAHSFPHQR